MPNPLLAMALAAAALLFSASANADCIEITKPYNIKSPGRYCLAAELIAPSNGNRVNADDVDLDCAGYTIDVTSQMPSTTNRGIVGYGRTHVTIRNCRIKGFIEGIRLTGIANVIRDNVVIAPYARGIAVEGDNNIIDRNLVSDVGGTSNYSWGAFGILAKGPSLIRDNVVSGVVPTAGSKKSGYGIFTTDNDSGVVQGNAVRNIFGDGGKIAMALTADDSSNALLSGNILVNPTGAYSFAVYCTGDDNYSNGNVLFGFDNGISPACTSVVAE
ncbi:MAG: right-handed parallel beta-helix repeat-containing protein [Luteimonas sp.]